MASKTVTRSIISVQYNNVNVVVKSVLKFLFTMKCHDWQLQLKEQWLLFICNLTWASAVHPGCTLLVCDGSRFSLEKY